MQITSRLLRVLRSLSILLIPLTATAGAQDQLWESFGSGDDLFGFTLARTGDLNGDGVADLVAGASHDDTNGLGAGAVHALSGADGASLRTLFGEGPSSFFGAAVAAADDVDGDGIHDVVVGAPGDYRAGTPPGKAFVYSGVDGSLLGTLLEQNPSEQFGVAVAGLGDVDQDGFADLAVSAPRRAAYLRGGVSAFSSRTGAVLWEVLGDASLDYFGVSMCRVPDTNGDGVDDLFVGSNGGYARMLSGLDGTELFTSRRGYPNDGYGSQVAIAGDLGYDGIPELLVGAPVGGTNGQVYVLNGTQGELYYLLEGQSTFEAFGQSVAGAGDLNGDGRQDWLVGAPNRSFPDGRKGAVYAYSGMNGKLIHTFTGDPDENFGFALAGNLNANGDGFPDFAVGAPTFGATDGRVVMIAGNDLFLTAEPAEVASGETLTLEVRLGTPYRDAAIYLVDLDGIAVFLPVDAGTFDQEGVFRFSAVVPAGITGHVLTFRAYGRHWNLSLLDSTDVVVTIL